MWKEITRDEYMIRVSELKPIETFSDPEGTSPYGTGRPYMETIWGHSSPERDVGILKCITSKSDCHQENWDEEYYERGV
jgi:hypothetical protein